MKKKLCTIILALILVLTVTACGKSASDKDNNSESSDKNSGDVSDDVSSDTSSTEKTTEDTSEDITTEDENFVYYMDTIELGNPQAEMSTKLFDGNFTAPLDLYEIAEFCLPLKPSGLIRNEAGDGWIEQFDTVEDAFIMDEEVTHSLHYILLSQNEEANNAELYTINFRCYDDWDVYKDESWNWKTKTTINECINRNLWNVQMCSQYSSQVVTSSEWNDIDSEAWNTALGLGLEGTYTDRDVLDRMIELNGNPSLLLEDSIPNVYYATDIAYYLAWEYDEYTLLMYITEIKDNPLPEILECNYYTTELWENYKPYLIYLYEIDEL